MTEPLSERRDRLLAEHDRVQAEIGELKHLIEDSESPEHIRSHKLVARGLRLHQELRAVDRLLPHHERKLSHDDPSTN